jgi:serine/threonine protein kinase
VKCPRCGAANEDTAEVCFECREVVKAITRGTVLLDRYEILETLGRGGMGVVYKAKDRVLDEVVAVKTLHTDFANDQELAWRFRTEIKLARKVSHKNVCRIFEYGEQDHLRFISMEYIEGKDLKRLIRDRGPLPPHEAYDVAIQAARGVAAIHDVGIIHRDLKTMNIMIDRDGVVRLMDFGIAKLQDRDATSGTGTGQILGTPEYMSPEQARAQPIDARADVYALGIVVYEIFTGQVPFRGQTPVATLFMHVQDPPPLDGTAAARLPPALVPVLRRALAKEPGDRFASATEMAHALEAARAGTPAAMALDADQPTVAGGSPVAVERKHGQGSLIVAVAVMAVVTVALFRSDLLTDTSPPSAAISTPESTPATPSPVGPMPSPEPSAALPSEAPPVPGAPTHEPPRAAALLRLVVVPFAEVTIDGQPAGRVEDEALSLEAGTHEVVLSHPDYEPLRREIELLAGAAIDLRIDLEKEGTPR